MTNNRYLLVLGVLLLLALGACGDNATNNDAICGDSVATGTEICDGTDLLGQDCATIGMSFTGGTLGCQPSCLAWDTAGCTTAPICGNGVVEAGEICDGTELFGQDCVTIGVSFNGGTLGCQPSCQAWDTAGCTTAPVCGNDLQETGEICDGTDLSGQDCTTIGMSFNGGTLACQPSCLAWDTAGCTTAPVCGNGVVEAGEICDGTELLGNDCTTLGFGYTGGTLACLANCAGWNLSDCATCGDGAAESGEVCDTLDLNGNSCLTLGLGFTGGTLGCQLDCTAFDIQSCDTCGNDLQETGEICDGTDLLGQDCTTIGMSFTGGNLGCQANCQGWNTQSCTTCGNGFVETGEICDGPSLSGNNCTTIGMGFAGGQLGCQPNCTQWNTSLCLACVDECVTGTRECDGDGYKDCGDYDSDTCLDWGPVIACAAGESCSNGYCDTGCSNECTAGAVQCGGTTGTQVCGDYDSDTCLELGPIVPCGPGETCSNGACSTTCSDECPAANDPQCTTSGAGYQVCDFYGASACLTWGPAINCAVDETCTNGTCDFSCDCDFTSGICEPDSPGSTTACSCDPDCATGTPCDTDGYCDSWCPPTADLDCDCGCDYNEYCEAGTQGGTDTCACDPDCEPNEWACSDDGHCDAWCPVGWDPDCGGVDACRDRWMLVGYREANQMWLSGSYDDPDTGEGSPWVELSPGLSSGSAETLVEFAAENMGCVSSVRIEAWGYDDSLFGDGAEVYLYNWDTFQFDLMPDATINVPEGFFTNIAVDPAPYMLCGTGAAAKCYIDVKIGASAWDQTHLWDVWVDVYMTP